VVYYAPARARPTAGGEDKGQEADMQELSTSQRILLRVVVVVVILVILAMFGLVERSPIVY
jgi:hypothetical protein